MRVLIVEDGDQRGPLTATRALARSGWVVAIGAPHKGHSARSRHCARWHYVPRPVDGLDAFIEAVRAAVVSGSYEVVFAGGDAELLALSKRRDDLGGARFPHSPDEVVRRALDKISLTELAREAGIAVPATSSTLDDLNGEVVVKERLHGDPLAADPVPKRIDAAVREGSDAAKAAFEAIHAAGGRPVVQERLPGPLMALVTLSDRNGRLLAAAQQVTEMTFPPDAGVSVRARSVPLDDALVERAAELLHRLGWFGVAELQFIVPEGGTPHLIDLNGRFYGSSALALAAGADLISAWASLATDRAFSLPTGFRAGVRYQWLEGDIRRAVAAGSSRARLRELLGCVAYAPGAAHSIWRIDDPLPALSFTSKLVRAGFRKAFA